MKNKKVVQLQYKGHTITVVESGYAGCPTTGFKCSNCRCTSSSVNTNPPANYLSEKYIKEEFDFFHPERCCDDTMTQSPEQTTPSPSEEKADWKKQFDQQFVKDNGQDIEPSFKDPNGDVGPVKQFIQTKIDQAKAEARAEAFDEVIQFIKPISKSYSREHDKTSYEVNRCLVDLMRCIEELKKI